MNKDNNTLTFKTNINCGGCIAKVKPFLDEKQGIAEWEVNTENKDKILTVTLDGISPNEVVETVKGAGFKIERID